MNNQQRQGLKLALLTALISGVANFVNKKVLISGIDPITLNVAKNSLVGIALLGFSFFTLKELKNYPVKNWLKLILIAIIGGSVPFILYFKGLAMSSAITGAFIHKTIFIWVAIGAVFFLKEKINKYQLAGLGILLAGLLPILKFNLFSLGRGELMMFAAVGFWAIEVILIKKFIKDIDYRILAVFRMALGAVLISLYALAAGNFSGIFRLTPVDWGKILITAIFLFGYVYTWYRALNFAPASAVTSILTLALPITIIMSTANAFQFPNINDSLTIILTITGVFLFSKSFIKHSWIQRFAN